MKLTKRLLCVLFCFLCATFVGCEASKEPYKFLNDTAQISTIEIGYFYIEPYSSVRAPSFESLTVIENHEEFLTDFRAVTSYKEDFMQDGLNEKQLVIKILYQNNEYEMIGEKGQLYHTIDRRYHNLEDKDLGYHYENSGYFYFEEDEFNALLNKYLPSQQ